MCFIGHRFLCTRGKLPVIINGISSLEFVVHVQLQGHVQYMYINLNMGMDGFVDKNQKVYVHVH
jgi:hypothetical protein